MQMINWPLYASTGQIAETESCDLSLAECAKLAGVNRGATQIAEDMSVSRKQVDRWFNDNHWKFDTVLLGISIRLKAEQINNVVSLEGGLAIRDLLEDKES